MRQKIFIVDEKGTERLVTGSKFNNIDILGITRRRIELPRDFKSGIKEEAHPNNYGECIFTDGAVLLLNTLWNGIARVPGCRWDLTPFM